VPRSLNFTANVDGAQQVPCHRQSSMLLIKAAQCFTIFRRGGGINHTTFTVRLAILSEVAAIVRYFLTLYIFPVNDKAIEQGNATAGPSLPRNM
jgi:hypothetical protein